MQVPYRKPGKFTHLPSDPLMTEAKFADFERKLEQLKKNRPHAAEEVARLAQLGDFSENAEYQLAKGRLRGINNNILKIESQINRAEIIPNREPTGTVQVGNRVTVEYLGQQKTFQILGSTEADPERGIISYQSPIGAMLIGCRVGEKIAVTSLRGEIEYTVISIQ